MNTYLAIITTVLVLTQIIRLIQNAIQLHLLRDYLEREMNVNESSCDLWEDAYVRMTKQRRTNNE